MKSDPKKKGIPLFLQVQNRVPLTQKQKEHLRAINPLVTTERVDWRKPKSMTWKEWDDVLAREKAKNDAVKAERFAELKARKVVTPNIREGLLSVQHFADKLKVPPRVIRQAWRATMAKPKYGWAFTPADEAKAMKAATDFIKKHGRKK